MDPGTDIEPVEPSGPPDGDVAETPAVLFNRGMALLFLGQLTEARMVLTKAVAVLPEAGGWNALARLYLAVAEIHG